MVLPTESSERSCDTLLRLDESDGCLNTVRVFLLLRDPPSQMSERYASTYAETELNSSCMNTRDPPPIPVNSPKNHRRIAATRNDGSTLFVNEIAIRSALTPEFAGDWFSHALATGDDGGHRVAASLLLLCGTLAQRLFVLVCRTENTSPVYVMPLETGKYSQQEPSNSRTGGIGRQQGLRETSGLVLCVRLWTALNV